LLDILLERNKPLSLNVLQSIETIREKLKKDDISSALRDIRVISAFPLKILDYQKINRLIEEYRDRFLAHLGGESLRVAILGGYTTQPIAVALRTFLLAEGYLVDIYESEYDSYKMEVLNPQSGLYTFKPHIVLFATGPMNINTFPHLGSSSDEVKSLVNAFVEEYRSLWSAVKGRIDALIIQHNFEPLEGSILGRLENKYHWSRSRFIQNINERFLELDGREIHVLDVNGLAVRIGVHNWYDPRWYHHSKHGYNPNLTFEYGRLFAGLFRALMGKAKKCLVVDLDNTLWGGVIGDDGIQDIHLGNVSAQGEAYKAFCNYLKELKNRGVILAANSKNDPALAKEVFTKHPEMPLSLDDFSAFYCNWESKSLNLREIAQELNIGIDALVFIDDNSVECAEVRELVPEATVVEMDGDPAYFIRKLDQLHLFDQLDITSEDFGRSESYLAQREINKVQQSSSSLEEFLVSLNMEGRVYPATLEDIPRIEQMFKKTNQFNLTSCRYDRDAILEFINNNDRFCFACWLKDKFANYGLVSTIVGNIKEEKLQIDNWVMSCRVFSRTFEEFIFNQIKIFAAKLSCSIIEGKFIPSAKNSYAKDLFSKLGFTCGGEEAGSWMFHLSNVSEKSSFVKE